MKKKVISAVLALSLLATFSIPAYATPEQDVIESQQKYDELTKKIDDLNGKVYELNAQIEPLVEKIENNKSQMEQIKVEITNTQNEIEASKAKIEENEKILSKRLREVYKSGGQSSMLMLLFSANGFNDLISKLDSTNRIVGLDKKVITELKDKKNTLDEKIAELDSKNTELTQINTENQTALSDLEQKKTDQEKLASAAKDEQEVFERDFLEVAERKLIESQLATAASSSSTVTDLQNAVTQLQQIRDNQIKSDTVVSEINDSIGQATDKIGQLQEIQRQNEEAQAQAQINRGGTDANGIVEQTTAPTATESQTTDSAVAQAQTSAPAQVQASAPAQAQTSAPAQASAPAKVQAPAPVKAPSAPSASGSAIVSYAYGFLGTPYVWGGTTPSGFDCSGFTSYVYRNVAGTEISRTTYSQVGQGVAVSQGELQPGDLVFTYGGEHVGIYVGGGNYIHAPQPGEGVKVSQVQSFYAGRRILR